MFYLTNANCYSCGCSDCFFNTCGPQQELTARRSWNSRPQRREASTPTSPKQPSFISKKPQLRGVSRILETSGTNFSNHFPTLPSPLKILLLTYKSSSSSFWNKTYSVVSTHLWWIGCLAWNNMGEILTSVRNSVWIASLLCYLWNNEEVKTHVYVQYRCNFNKNNVRASAY